MPGWLKAAPLALSGASEPPQLLLMAFAPRAAARFSAVPRFAKELVFASTSRMWQPGQMAETMSRSSEISSAQPGSTRGYLFLPFWSTLRKQPLAVVQAGRPNCDRYTPRSASAVGSSNASTIATVWLADPDAVRLYAERRLLGP